jgi:ssRNA-specific RNase YbeY (16S rRNA maturation enzyme)
MPGDNHMHSAEIFVNVERAVVTAQKRNGWSASKELALYIAHGCDHLISGENDANAAERMRMRRRELRWLREAPEANELFR